jgi:hypothetical protein
MSQLFRPGKRPPRLFCGSGDDAVSLGGGAGIRRDTPTEQFCFSNFFVRFLERGLKREQLLRRLAQDAGRGGGNLSVDMARGKDGHCVVRFGTRFSVIKSGEITPLMEKVIRKQLGL